MTRVMTRVREFFHEITIGKSVLILLMPLISILIDLKGLIFALCLMITIDLITGIIKYYHGKNVKFNIFKVNSLLLIQSELLRYTLKKCYEYGFLFIVALIIDLLVFEGMAVSLVGKEFIIPEFALIIPIGIETWSIFENIEGVSGNNLFKKLVSFLPEKIQKIFSDANN